MSSIIIDSYLGQEFPIPEIFRLINEYAEPNCFDCMEITFKLCMLQKVLPERLHKIIIDKLFRLYATVEEVAFTRDLGCGENKLVVMEGM